jgi:MFS family permease
MATKPPLWTRNYIFACTGNFISYFGFCLVLPIMPMFLIEKYGILQSKTGIILASFTFSAMITRPFFAYLSDLYNRKKVFCLLFLLYSFLFLPYPFIAGGVLFFVILRGLHGASFGAKSVCGNAIIVDIVDEKRRGEGFGYFGISNNLGMAMAPMLGLYMHETLQNSFVWIFIVAFLMCMAGFLIIINIHLPKDAKQIKIPKDKEWSFDKFYQIKGIFAGISLIFLSFPYGLIVSFTALYGKELGISGNTGLFFAFMSLGLIISRISSGKLIDRGKLTTAISLGAFSISGTLLLFAGIGLLSIENFAFLKLLFFIVGFLFGLSYGIIFPAFNTLFVNLAPDNRRAAASSTYLTNWDIGLGVGLISGGVIMEKKGMPAAYLTAAILSFVSAIYFTLFVAGHFKRNKLR